MPQPTEIDAWLKVLLIVVGILALFPAGYAYGCVMAHFEKWVDSKRPK